MNKKTVFEQEKLAEIENSDGVSIFAPKITTKKADCVTLIQKLW